MTSKQIFVGILSSSTFLVGGVDSVNLKEQPLHQVEQISVYQIEAKQIGNTVEAVFPWKDQQGLKVSYDMGEPTVLEKMIDERHKQVVTERVNFEDGGFKIDVILNKKPDTNTFCYTIEGAENYDFFYQPALTKQDIEDGLERPNDIVGSYAVYHKNLKNHIIGQENYATGKVLHIPRPQVWEVKNEQLTKEWAELSYKEGILCVIVRQGFLDKAKYPVRVDPTFGYTTAGASASTITTGSTPSISRVSYRQGEPITGTLTSITSRIYLSGSNSNIDWYTYISERDGSGADSHTQIVSDLENQALTTSPQWITNTVSASLSCSLCMINVHSGLVGTRKVIMRYDTVASFNRYVEAFGSAAAATESPWTDTATAGTQHLSMYATYTSPPAGSEAQSEAWF